MKPKGRCPVCGKLGAIRQDGCPHSHNTLGTDWWDYQEQWRRLCHSEGQQAIPVTITRHDCPHCRGHETP